MNSTSSNLCNWICLDLFFDIFFASSPYLIIYRLLPCHCYPFLLDFSTKIVRSKENKRPKEKRIGLSGASVRALVDWISVWLSSPGVDLKRRMSMSLPFLIRMKLMRLRKKRKNSLHSPRCNHNDKATPEMRKILLNVDSAWVKLYYCTASTNKNNITPSLYL